MSQSPLFVASLWTADLGGASLEDLCRVPWRTQDAFLRYS
jgi:hypothetical protein